MVEPTFVVAISAAFVNVGAAIWLNETSLNAAADDALDPHAVSKVVVPIDDVARGSMGAAPNSCNKLRRVTCEEDDIKETPIVKC